VTRDLYRPGVGIMLVNADGKVWVGQRLDNALDAWQMPQGGVDPGEDIEEAMFRELGEETGIGRDLVEIVTRAEEELTYDLPEELIGVIWKKKWRGQRQTWFLVRFRGEDRDVDIAGPDPEFRAWKWVEPRELPSLIVPFKRALYRDIVRLFSAWL
jgi:putative (di)nucleoside polyphosphate hydrolase